MTVIKSSGNLQDFNINKLRLSIEKASDNCKAPMTSSDLDLIVRDVSESISSNFIEQKISTNIIRKFIIASLEKHGFNLVAKHYRDD